MRSCLVLSLLVFAMAVVGMPAFGIHAEQNEASLCAVRILTRSSPILPERCIAAVLRLTQDEQPAVSHVRLLTRLALDNERFAVEVSSFEKSRYLWIQDPLAVCQVALLEQLRTVTRDGDELTQWHGLVDSPCVAQYAVMFRAQGRYDTALRANEFAYQLDAGWQDEWSRALNAWAVGKALHEKGDLEAAKQALTAAIPGLLTYDKEIGKEYASYALGRLGEIAEQQGDKRAALGLYTQSIIVSPKHADFFRLSNLLQSQGYTWEEIYAIFAELGQLGTREDPYFWANFAAVFRELGALDQVARILAETPPELANSRIIRGKQAQLAADRGEWHQAADLSKALLEESRLQGDINEIAGWANSLGETLMQLSFGDQAAVYFEEATLLAPSVPYYWFNLGQAYRQQERTAEAKAAFAQALQLKPDYDKAQQALSEMEN